MCLPTWGKVLLCSITVIVIITIVVGLQEEKMWAHEHATTTLTIPTTQKIFEETAIDKVEALAKQIRSRAARNLLNNSHINISS